VLKFFGILLVIALILFGAGFIYVNRLISPNWLEKKAEEEFAGNFMIGKVKLASLWPNTNLVLTNFSVTDPDSQNEGPELRAETLDLKVDLASLLKREIVVKRLAFDGLKVKGEIPEKGKIDLARLFKKRGEGKSVVEDVRKPKKKKSDKKKKFGNEKKVAKSVTLEEIIFRNSHVNLSLEKAGLVIDLAKVNLGLKDIRVDPSALERVNEANLELETELSLRSEKDDVYALLGISGPAKVTLFSALTGELDPVVETDWLLTDQSYVNTDTPAIRKALSYLKKLEKIGVKAGGLPKSISFSKNHRLALRWGKKRLDVLSPVEMGLKDWAVGLEEGCWWQTDSDDVNAGLRFSAPEKFTAKTTSLLGKFDKYIPKEIRGDGDSPLSHMIKDGRLSLEVDVKGSFKKPKVTLKTKVIDVSDNAIRTLEKGLRSLFK